MEDLINRLRGVYTGKINDGGGLLYGKDTFTRVFETPPICKEAALFIEAQAAELLTLQDRYNAQEREIRKLKKECLKWEDIAKEWHEKYFKKCGDEFIVLEQALTQLKAKEG